MNKLSVHCFLHLGNHIVYWIEQLQNEKVGHFYLHNVSDNIKELVKDNSSVTVLSGDSGIKITDLHYRTSRLNESIKKAREDGYNWLLNLNDTDILDVRTSVTFPQLLNSLQGGLSHALVSVYEVVKTINKPDYNFFINEDYAYSKHESFVDPRNVNTNVSVTPNVSTFGNRILLNLNCKSLVALNEKKVSVQNPEEASKMSKVFNAEKKAWRILSYSMCDFKEWALVNPLEEGEDPDDQTFLFETTVSVEEETIQEMHRNGEVFIVDEAQMMNVQLSNPPPTPPINNTNVQNKENKDLSKEIKKIQTTVGNLSVDQMINSFKIVVDALEVYKSTLEKTA